MASPTYCSVCDRTVYVADGDDFACPVCSSPLPETSAASVQTEPAGTSSEYYLG